MLMGLPNRGTLGAHLVAIEKHRASGNTLDIRGNADRTYKYLQPLKVTNSKAFYNLSINLYTDYRSQRSLFFIPFNE